MRFPALRAAWGSELAQQFNIEAFDIGWRQLAAAVSAGALFAFGAKSRPRRPRGRWIVTNDFGANNGVRLDDRLLVPAAAARTSVPSLASAGAKPEKPNADWRSRKSNQSYEAKHANPLGLMAPNACRALAEPD